MDGLFQRNATRLLTNCNRPEVDRHEEGNICKLLQREEKGENMIRYALGPAIHWMKCMARERRRHDPFVVRLVQRLVEAWMVQGPMNPVYEAIGEKDEKGELQQVVQWEWRIGWHIIELGIPSDLGDEEG